MTDAELTCQQFVELVTDYLDEVMTPDARSRFEVTCPSALDAPPTSTRSAPRDVRWAGSISTTCPRRHAINC